MSIFRNGGMGLRAVCGLALIAATAVGADAQQQPAQAPLTETVAPKTGLPVAASVTFPVIVRCCAINWKKQNSMKTPLSRIFFLIIKLIK